VGHGVASDLEVRNVIRKFGELVEDLILRVFLQTIARIVDLFHVAKQE